MRPKFITLNVVILCFCFSAWWAGFFSFTSLFGVKEIIMLSILGVYSSFGFGAIIIKKWNICRHIANGTPMFALAMTGLGMLLATTTLDTLTPQALAQVFKDMVMAISPNILGIFLLAWLRELAFWCGNEEI